MAGSLEISAADRRRVERSRGSATYGELMPTATLRLLSVAEGRYVNQVTLRSPILGLRSSPSVLTRTPPLAGSTAEAPVEALFACTREGTRASTLLVQGLVLERLGVKDAK